jgi:hypothetical protein
MAFLKAGGGLVDLVLAEQSGPQIVMEFGFFRLKVDGFAKAGDGLVHLAFGTQRSAHVGVSHGVFLVQLDGLAKAGDGPIIIPFDITEAGSVHSSLTYRFVPVARSSFGGGSNLEAALTIVATPALRNSPLRKAKDE